MRAMVLGAAGLLGHDLVATAPPDMTLFPFPRGDLDITDTEALAATVREVRPDVVINAAAYTAVDRAESEADAAFRVNGAAVGELPSGTDSRPGRRNIERHEGGSARRP